MHQPLVAKLALGIWVGWVLGGQANNVQEPGKEANYDSPRLLGNLGTTQQKPQEAQEHQGLQRHVNRMLPANVNSI